MSKIKNIIGCVSFVAIILSFSLLIAGLVYTAPLVVECDEYTCEYQPEDPDLIAQEVIVYFKDGQVGLNKTCFIVPKVGESIPNPTNYTVTKRCDIKDIETCDFGCDLNLEMLLICISLAMGLVVCFMLCLLIYQEFKKQINPLFGYTVKV